jgi:hypothetical protein
MVPWDSLYEREVVGMLSDIAFQHPHLDTHNRKSQLIFRFHPEVWMNRFF